MKKSYNCFLLKNMFICVVLIFLLSFAGLAGAASNYYNQFEMVDIFEIEHNILTEEEFSNNWPDWPEYTTLNSWPFDNGNCTWYAYGRMLQLGYNKDDLDTISGNAGDWNVTAGGNTQVADKPQVASIAHWNPHTPGAPHEFGHVAVVEQINPDGSILLSQSNWGVDTALYEKITIPAGSDDWPCNFIIIPKADEPYEAGVFDLMVSLDWDPDADPVFNKSFLEGAFEEFAERVFTMTEGRNLIRNLYIFSDVQHTNNADIRIYNTPGRANAMPAGFLNTGHVNIFTKWNETRNIGEEEMGRIMAHELGHYAYKLYDEYRERLSLREGETRRDAKNRLRREPFWPRPGDHPRETIMNNHMRYDRLSTASDYPPHQAANTAQWRVYGYSAWETLVRDPADDKRANALSFFQERQRFASFENMAAPTTEQLTNPDLMDEGLEGVLTLHWMDDTEDDTERTGVHVLVVDVSGSMSASDVTLDDGSYITRMQAARDASNIYVDMMRQGEKVAVVSFSSDAAIEQDLTTLNDATDWQDVRDTINALDHSGMTNFSAGLYHARDILSADGMEQANRSVIFMSDGGINQGEMDYKIFTQWFRENNVPVHTIGFGHKGSVDEVTLKNMADETGGEYAYSPTSESELRDIYAGVHMYAGDEMYVSRERETLPEGTVHEFKTLVSPEDSNTRFLVMGNVNDIDFKLISPAGDEFTGDSDEYFQGENVAYYTVEAPAPGTWISRVETTSDSDISVTYQVTSRSNISLDLEIAYNDYPDPIGIMATVGSSGPVVGATVEAVITTPDEDQLTIPLRDDGISPDAMSGDGVYSGAFAGYTDSGNYSIEVRVTNPDGEAIVDSSGALVAGEDYQPTSLPEFTRVASDSINVTVEDLPSDSLNAQPITTDNTPYSGAITAPDAESWYRFEADQGITYYIQTSMLWGWDSNDMATRIELYDDQDATTMLEFSEYYEETNISFIGWTAPNDGDYYVKVTHPEDNVCLGNFTLTAGTTSVFTTQDEEGLISRPEDLETPDLTETPELTTKSQTVDTASIAVEGTAVPNASISVTGGAERATGVSDDDGNFSIEVLLQPNTVNSLEVRARDLNEGETASKAARVAITHQGGEENPAPENDSNDNGPDDEDVRQEDEATEDTTDGEADEPETEENNSNDNGPDDEDAQQEDEAAEDTTEEEADEPETEENNSNDNGSDDEDAQQEESTNEEPASTSKPVITTETQTVNEQTFTINGQTEPHAAVKITFGDNKAQGEADKDGNFSISLNLLPDEVNTLKVKAQSEGKEMSEAATVKITHETDDAKESNQDEEQNDTKDNNESEAGDDADSTCEATNTVNALFADEEKIKDDVDKDDIEKALSLVRELEDGKEKDALLRKLVKAENQLDEKSDSRDHEIRYGYVLNQESIGVGDAIAVLRHVVGLELLDGGKLERAKVTNGDDNLTVQDAIVILRYVVGLTTEFPREQQ